MANLTAKRLRKNNTVNPICITQPLPPSTSPTISDPTNQNRQPKNPTNPLIPTTYLPQNHVSPESHRRGRGEKYPPSQSGFPAALLTPTTTCRNSSRHAPATASTYTRGADRASSGRQASKPRAARVREPAAIYVRRTGGRGRGVGSLLHSLLLPLLALSLSSVYTFVMIGSMGRESRALSVLSLEFFPMRCLYRAKAYKGAGRDFCQAGIFSAVIREISGDRRGWWIRFGEVGLVLSFCFS